MAMSTSSFVRPVMPQEFLPGIKTQFINQEIFKVFGAPQPWAGKGKSVYWPINIGNTSSNAGVISEGAAVKAADDSTHAEAAVAMVTYNASGELTWEAQQSGVGTMDSSVEDTTANLIHAANVGMISTLEGSVAASGSYAGLTRTSYASALVSGSEATNTALTETHLKDALEWLLTASAGGRKATPHGNLVILCNPDMYFKISALMTPDAGNPIVVTAGQSHDGGDIFPYGAKGQWNGIPIVQIQGMTTGTVLMGDRTTVVPFQTGDPEMIDLGKTTLSSKYSMAWLGQLVNKVPSQWYSLIDKD
jgi:hypothetical protein